MQYRRLHLKKKTATLCMAGLLGLGLQGCSVQYADPYYGYLDEEKTFANQGFIATMNQGGPFVRHPKKPERWKDLPAYSTTACDLTLERTPRALKKFEAQVAKHIPSFTTSWRQNTTQLQLEVPQESVFFVDASHLRPDAYPQLEALSSLIEGNDFKVRFVGHTDATGSDAYNQTLSAQRALHLQRYFVLKGLAQYRSSNQAMGESSPIASNKTTNGRKKNRRVSMIFCTINKKGTSKDV